MNSSWNWIIRALDGRNDQVIDTEQLEIHPLLNCATFEHHRLNTSVQEVRLLRVLPIRNGQPQLQLEHFELSTAPPYRALSYVWGPETPIQQIQINEQAYSVRQNLYDFLLELTFNSSNFGEGYLWIDQVCIDQSATEERNHQVQMMSDIYRASSTVIIWLGSATISDHAATRAIRDPRAARRVEETDIKNDLTRYNLRYGLAPPLPVEISQMASNRIRSSLLQFFGKTYWKRLWVVQEILLASSLEIWCGEIRLSWGELQDFCSGGVSHSSLGGDNGFEVPDGILWLASQSKQAFGMRLDNLVETFCEYECLDSRDKIYGLQGILKPVDRLTVDYEKSVEEVFIDVALRMFPLNAIYGGTPWKLAEAMGLNLGKAFWLAWAERRFVRDAFFLGSPEWAREMTADLVLRNGMQLEEWVKATEKKNSK